MVAPLRIAVEALRTTYPSASNPYWRSLPLRRLGRLLIGSFLLTSVAGFGVNLLFVGRPVLHGLLWPILVASFITAMLIARLVKPRWLTKFPFLQYRQFGVLMNSLMFLVGFMAFLFGSRMQDSVEVTFEGHKIQSELFFDAAGIWLGVVFGSRLVLSFLTTEGVSGVRMQTELALAHGIQSTLVPSIGFNTPRFEVYGVSVPSSEMGGDLIDAIQKESGLLVYVADVSGHGLPAGQLMGMLKTAIRVSLDLCRDSVGILENADRIFAERQTASHVRGARTNAFRLCIPRGRIRVGGTWSDSALRKSKNEMVRLRMEQLPLGLLPGTDYSNSRFSYSPGDLFVVVTDFIIEVVNAKNEELGLDRVADLILRMSAEPLETIWGAIRTLATARGPQHDDQSALLIRAI